MPRGRRGAIRGVITAADSLESPDDQSSRMKVLKGGPENADGT
jgi:hypothetical protein